MNPSGFGIFEEVGWEILGAERSQVQVLSPRLFRSTLYARYEFWNWNSTERLLAHQRITLPGPYDVPSPSRSSFMMSATLATSSIVSTLFPA